LQRTENKNFITSTMSVNYLENFTNTSYIITYEEQGKIYGKMVAR